MINFISILKNFGANGLTVLFNTLFQFISVPIFLSYWGVDLYSDWLVLTSLTAYFMMTDIGLNTVTMNEIGISYGKNEINRCNILFNNNLFFIISVFILILLLVISLTWIFDFKSILMLESVSNNTTKIIIICLIIQSFVGMTSGLYDSLYRVTDRTANGVMINNFAKFSESIILLTGIILGLELAIIIVIYIIPRFIALFYKVIQTKFFFEIKISTKFLSYNELKKIIIPAFSFLSFPVGNSIILQGFTLLINFTIGNLALVIYNTLRTLTNVVKLCIGLVNNSVWPELTLLYGKSDILNLRKLLRYCLGISFYFSLFASLFLFFFAEPVYEFWTNNEITFDRILVLCFLISVVTHTIWNSLSIVLISTNNHKKLSIYYILGCFLSILIGYFILKINNTVSYLPLSFLIIDIFLIFIVFNESLKITSDKWSLFIKNVILTPIKILVKTKNNFYKIEKK